MVNITITFDEKDLDEEQPLSQRLLIIRHHLKIMGWNYKLD